MIIVGTAEVNTSTGQVELIAPMGFNTAEGVRLSNFTGDTVTITGINGRDQSQEYLAPQTQMVYATANIGVTPTAIAQVYPPSQVADNLLVEWSTDPDNDFIGTYPAALPAAISSTHGTSLVSAMPNTHYPAYLPSPTTYNLGQLPGSAAIVDLGLEYATNTSPIIVELFETTSDPYGVTGYAAYARYIISIAPTASKTQIAIPLRLTHISDLQLRITPPPNTVINVFYNVYALNTDDAITVPLSYAIVPPSQYEVTKNGDATGTWLTLTSASPLNGIPITSYPPGAYDLEFLVAKHASTDTLTGAFGYAFANYVSTVLNPASGKYPTWCDTTTFSDLGDGMMRFRLSNVNIGMISNIYFYVYSQSNTTNAFNVSVIIIPQSPVMEV